MAALLRERFLGGIEGGGPEGDGLVEVVDVDDELTDPAAVAHDRSASTRS